MQIQFFQMENLEDCAALLIKAYNGAPWDCNWTMETSKRYLQEYIDNPRFVGFTIHEEDKLIGAAFCHEKTWWTDDELFVDEFYISPDVQRKGYGEALLNHIGNYIKEKKLAGFTLLTNRYMPSSRFYKKHGFVDAEHVMFMYKVV